MILLFWNTDLELPLNKVKKEEEEDKHGTFQIILLGFG